jgi:predicted nuclease of predicted toxin-antitoxin system
MSLNFVIDMNLSPEWVEVFSRHNWRAVHWSTIGSANADDRLIMQWALDHNHIIFTHDLDFNAILAATHAVAPSVIQLRAQDILPQTFAGLVIAAIQQFEEQLRQGARIVIDPQKARAHVLPIIQSQN